MVGKRIALIITSMFLTGGMLITACAVYHSNYSKEMVEEKLIISEMASTSIPEYLVNSENIKNLVIQELQVEGLWFPEQPVTGDDAASLPLGCYMSDKEYAQQYMNANYRNSAPDKGVSSVSCWIEDGCVRISASSCDFPDQGFALFFKLKSHILLLRKAALDT